MASLFLIIVVSLIALVLICTLILIFGRRRSRRDSGFSYDSEATAYTPPSLLSRIKDNVRSWIPTSDKAPWLTLNEFSNSNDKQFVDAEPVDFQGPAHSIDPYYYDSIEVQIDPHRRSLAMSPTGGSGAGPSRIVDELGKIIEKNGARTNQLQRLFHLRGAVLMQDELEVKFEEGECSTVRSKWPVTSIKRDEVDACYFEVVVLELDQFCTLAIGLSEAFRHQDAELPGYTPGSISLTSTGELHLGDYEPTTEITSPFDDEALEICTGSRTWTVGDVIGCGYHPIHGEIIFTINGEILGAVPLPTNIETKSLCTPGRRDLFAVMGAKSKDGSKGCRVKINFGKSDFKITQFNVEHDEDEVFEELVTKHVVDGIRRSESFRRDGLNRSASGRRVTIDGLKRTASSSIRGVYATLKVGEAEVADVVEVDEEPVITDLYFNNDEDEVHESLVKSGDKENPFAD